MVRLLTNRSRAKIPSYGSTKLAWYATEVYQIETIRYLPLRDTQICPSDYDIVVIAGQ